MPASQMDDYSAQPEPIRVYENTYKLALDDGTKFDSKVAQELLLRILDEKLEYLNEVDGKGKRLIAKGKLDPPDFERDFSDLTSEISEAVISQLTMAMKGSPRYKFACQTVIGEDDGQSVRVTSRCLWDTRTDNSASAVWKNGEFYATCMVFALHYE